MVTRGLQIGDVFEDGGRSFQVKEVCGDGSYISALYVAEKEAEKEAEKAETAEKGGKVSGKK